MIGIEAAFSRSYAQARVKFLEAAASAGLSIESHPHPLPGRDGEVLAMDVALDGSTDAGQLLIVSSACHGVEGFCGSGVQVYALHDAEWCAHLRDRGVTVLYIHALNPYGFSHLRRTTHENVDLNRNFHDFTRPLPINEGYRALNHLLLPPEWPPGEDNVTVFSQYLATHGEAALQAVISGGQHEFPDGIFYGGVAPTWSNTTLRGVLRRHGAKARRLGWIDLHTGLGPKGVGERIYAGADDPAALRRARAWWGDGVTSIHDGTSSSAFLTGLMWTAVDDECPQAQYTGIALEYGTVPLMVVLQALRAEHWLHLHPDAPQAQVEVIKANLLQAYYTDTPRWQGQIVSQARQAMFQAVEGLAT